LIRTLIKEMTLMANSTVKDGAKSPACLVCMGESSRIVFHRDSFDYYACPHCGLHYLDYNQAPVNQVTHELYGPRQLALDFFKDDAERQRHERRSRETLRRFASMVGKGRLLEVGCAEGFFLSVAKEEGWDPHGMDVEQQAAEYGREHFGVDIYCGPPGDAPWEDGYFDFIFMNNVMEHIVNPMEVLRTVHRVLRPGGILYIRTGSRHGAFDETVFI